MMNETVQRIKCLDILKAFSCIIVVYIHSFNIYSYSGKNQPCALYPIYIFTKLGVPLFFLISGYITICGGGISHI